MPGPSVHHYAGGTTEDLSAQLAQRCPAYFKEDDKIFYEASGLLQRAEAATAAAEKDHLTRSALKLMMKVDPLSSHSNCHKQDTHVICSQAGLSFKPRTDYARNYTCLGAVCGR